MAISSTTIIVAKVARHFGTLEPALHTFTFEMGQVVAILAATIYLFVSERVRVDVAAILVTVALGVTGLVPSQQIFSGFSSNAVISIIAIMIIGAGLDRTGIMSQLAGLILRIGGSTERRIIPIVSATVGFISSFMQNIGAATLFLPVVSRISTRTGIPLSRLLMPMGFSAILGGTLTMIGSSPLILLNDLLVASNAALPQDVAPMERFHLFSVTPVGVALVSVGILYFVLMGRKVLPSVRPGARDPGATTRYFEDTYDIKGNIFEVLVPLDSPLVGMAIRDIELIPDIPYIVGVRTADEIRLEPPADFEVPVGAVFALMGTEKQVKDFRREMKLELKPNLQYFVEVLNPTRAGIAEAVIPPGSEYVGKTVVDVRMRKSLGVNVLSVYRHEQVVRKDALQAFHFRSGDTIVLHSRWSDLQRIDRNPNLLVVTDFPREIARPNKVLPGVSFFLVAIGLALFSDLQLSLALLAGAVGMILTGVLSIDEAYRSVDWQTVFLLACLLPLGVAMETTDTAAWVAQELLRLLHGVPIWVLQAAMAILSTMFTLVMSNVGATVLLVPLAVNIAVGIGADPAVFALTVALAASNSFLLPTHQVNALIMGPAGYRVSDFMRVGGLMTALFLIVLLLMLNLVF